MQNILKGLRVVEGSAFVAAPSCGMALAQMGADVIRFDMIGGGLDYRRWPVDKHNQSMFWAGVNKGKRSIAVDFRKPQGREILTRLIALPGENAGIFLTNFPALGWLSDENLRKHREDLIYFNLTGDRHGSSAVDYTVNCEMGFPYTTGENQQPTNHVLPAWDIITGQMLVTGILAAERHRRLTGEGQFVELALKDVALATLGNLGYIGEVMVNGHDRPNCGNNIYGAFGRDFMTSDGERIMVAGITLGQWKSICKVCEIQTQVDALAVSLGLDLDREGDRYRAREPLNELVEGWFKQYSFVQAKQKLNEGGVCWGKYRSVSELVAHDPDCSTENPLFQRVEQPGIGNYLAAGHPLHFSALPQEKVMPAPLLGAHTDEILAECLGMSSAEIGQLHDQKIVAGIGA